jgi:hypothetical protein
LVFLAPSTQNFIPHFWVGHEFQSKRPTEPLYSRIA